MESSISQFLGTSQDNLTKNLAYFDSPDVITRFKNIVRDNEKLPKKYKKTIFKLFKFFLNDHLKKKNYEEVDALFDLLVVFMNNDLSSEDNLFEKYNTYELFATHEFIEFKHSIGNRVTPRLSLNLDEEEEVPVPPLDEEYSELKDIRLLTEILNYLETNQQFGGNKKKTKKKN